MSYKIFTDKKIIAYDNSSYLHFVFGLTPENIDISSAFMDSYGDEKFFDFVNKINAQKEQNHEYWTNGFTFRFLPVINQVEIFFRLDQGKHHLLPLKDFLDIFKIYMQEFLLFKKNPENYVGKTFKNF